MCVRRVCPAPPPVPAAVAPFPSLNQRVNRVYRQRRKLAQTRFAEQSRRDAPKRSDCRPCSDPRCVLVRAARERAARQYFRASFPPPGRYPARRAGGGGRFCSRSSTRPRSAKPASATAAARSDRAASGCRPEPAAGATTRIAGRSRRRAAKRGTSGARPDRGAQSASRIATGTASAARHAGTNAAHAGDPSAGR